jgi:hypothetical protein
MAAAIMSDPNAVRPSASDEIFLAATSDAASPPQDEVAAAADAQPATPTGAAGAADDDMEQTKKRTAVIKFETLKIFEKIRLATVGNAYCRQVLIRDTNRLVAMAVIRSPSISDREVVAAASNRAICDDVIRYIANSREYVKDYAVKQALVNNPKCPLGMSLRLLSFLHPEDLRAIARSRNVPGALATAAKKLAQTRNRSG